MAFFFKILGNNRTVRNIAQFNIQQLQRTKIRYINSISLNMFTLSIKENKSERLKKVKIKNHTTIAYG